MQEILINAGVLESAIKTLQPFASKEETRYYLNGIFFEWNEGEEQMNMVATDGNKLCVLKVAVDPAKDSRGKVSAIVPTSALKTTLQMLRYVKAEWPVALKFDEEKPRISVDCPDQKAEFKLIDGIFPDYRKVIPGDKPKFSIGFQKAQATEAMKAVSKHKSKEPMEWHMYDASSPLKLVGQDKIVVVMPCRTAFNEIDLTSAA